VDETKDKIKDKVSIEELKTQVEEGRKKLKAAMERASAKARETIDVDDLRRRLGALEQKLNREIDTLSSRAKAKLDSWLKR